jgi:hypothetical protein
MANIFLRHPRHGTKIAISQMEAWEDMNHGWEEFDPDAPEEEDAPSSAEMSASEPSIDNALRARRRRRG